LELLEIISAKCQTTQILVLVDPRALSSAFSALKVGSYLYAKLPVSDEELQMLVDTAMIRRPEYGSNLLLKEGGEQKGFEDMVGNSPPMRDVYRQIRLASMTDIPVLLTGETGTGKDLAARAIHQLSKRSEKPFVPIHLGALPAELVSSELFGYDKGAFTGAFKRYRGAFEQAHGGTVFLDEIGTIDEKNQISLLRLLETRSFQRIGGEKEIRVNTRIIAATNEDLTEAVADKRFREDLFYRLEVFPIVMPPVRNRGGDIPLLVDHFLKKFCDDYHKTILGVSPEYIQRMEAYDWPGNIREIKNVLHRSVVMCEGEVLLPDQLPERLFKIRPQSPSISVPLGSSIEEMEREMIARTLKWADNNRRRTAEILGISRRTLYNKIDKYGLF
jgi:DNA-binding NtrC family response regulator